VVKKQAFIISLRNSLISFSCPGLMLPGWQCVNAEAIAEALLRLWKEVSLASLDRAITADQKLCLKWISLCGRKPSVRQLN